MRVPEKASLGKAKVTFSFDAWLQGQVAATTVELPVVDPQSNAEEESQKESDSH